MSRADAIRAQVSSLLGATWDIRDGAVVPDTASVGLQGGGVSLDAAMLYADLANSSLLVDTFGRRPAAKILKAFLGASSRLIRLNGGAIRSFDGDRVMGVFVGPIKRTQAARTALAITWAVTQVIRPKVDASFASVRNSPFVIAHCTGVDVGTVLAVRGGVWGHNDLLWVGTPANLAAKLSSLREGDYCSYITEDVYRTMHVSAREHDGVDMWEPEVIQWHGSNHTVYRSRWWTQP